MAAIERVVVVGAGLAGLRSAQRLRETGFDGEITIVGDEAHFPYNRPPLSKQVLAGEQSPGECFFEYDDAQATWLLGNPANGLDLSRRVVRLTEGELPFDALVVATGRRARPWPGRLPAWSGFHVLRGLDDAVVLRDAAVPRSRVVIIGGGFVGCEVAGTLRRRGVTDVTVIEAAPHLLPALGPAAGRFAEALHRARGIRVECGAQVTEFHGSGQVEAVELGDGRRLGADLVLLALGSVANTEWLAGSGLQLDGGAVVCDARCYASGRPDVVAAGDVASWTHDGLGRPVRVEHWTNAAEMARAAADNLIGGPDNAVPFTPVPTFWSDQHEVKIKAAGFPALAHEYVVVDKDEEAARLVVEGYAGGELVAVITFNAARAFLAYRKRLAPVLAPAAPQDTAASAVPVGS